MPDGEECPCVVRKIEFNHHVRDNELLTSLLDVCDVRPLTFEVGTYLSNINSDMYFSCFDNHCPIHLACINSRTQSVICDLVAAKYSHDLYVAVDTLNFDTIAFDNICAELGLTGFTIGNTLTLTAMCAIVCVRF